MTNFLEEARSIEADITRWRRDFHQHPELRFEEHRTAGIVARHLEQLGIEVKTGVGKTGVVGLIRGKGPGPVALMRFDMDALPIQEENDVEYRSQTPGVMHACGHDAHTAVGMGVAVLLARHKDEFPGAVKLVFQPAEEGAGGALAMIQDGVLENPHVDYSFGIHIQSQTPEGVFLIGDGPILAAADIFRCEITGRGGHGAIPQDTIDAVVVASQIVNALQTITSRNVDPLKLAIVSTCTLHAGVAFNIIAEKAELTGNIRSFDQETRDLIHRRMHEIVEGTARTFGAKAELEIRPIVSAVVNNPEMCAQARKLAARLVGPENVSTDQVGTPSDDVGEFLRAAPGVHFVLGTARGSTGYMHHNAHFDLNEHMLPLGVAMFCEEAIHFLSGGAKEES